MDLRPARGACRLRDTLLLPRSPGSLALAPFLVRRTSSTTTIAARIATTAISPQSCPLGYPVPVENGLAPVTVTWAAVANTGAPAPSVTVTFTM